MTFSTPSSSLCQIVPRRVFNGALWIGNIPEIGYYQGSEMKGRVARPDLFCARSVHAVDCRTRSAVLRVRRRGGQGSFMSGPESVSRNPTEMIPTILLAQPAKTTRNAYPQRSIRDKRAKSKSGRVTPEASAIIKSRFHSQDQNSLLIP